MVISQELSPYNELSLSATEALLSPAHLSEDEGEGEGDQEEAVTPAGENWTLTITSQMEDQIERVSQWLL